MGLMKEFVVDPYQTLLKVIYFGHRFKKVGFFEKVKGVQGVYTIGFLSNQQPTLLISKSIYMPRWLSKDSKIVYSSGVPGAFVRGKVKFIPLKF